jgi:mRNA interferase MazF
VAVVIGRFAVYLVSLDPVVGAETAKTRPCVVVSPDDMNDVLATIIIAPMTTVRRHWPTRPTVTFQGKTGEIALDQIRTVDKTRLVKRLGKIDKVAATEVLETLAEMFAP